MWKKLRRSLAVCVGLCVLLSSMGVSAAFSPDGTNVEKKALMLQNFNSIPTNTVFANDDKYMVSAWSGGANAANHMSILSKGPADHAMKLTVPGNEATYKFVTFGNAASGAGAMAAGYDELSFHVDFSNCAGISLIHMVIFNTTGDMAYPFSTPISFQSDEGITTELANAGWNDYDITGIQGASGWLSLPITGLDWGGNPIVASDITGIAIQLKSGVAAGDYLEIDNVQLREINAPYLAGSEKVWNSGKSKMLQNFNSINTNTVFANDDQYLVAAWGSGADAASHMSVVSKSSADHAMKLTLAGDSGTYKFVTFGNVASGAGAVINGYDELSFHVDFSNCAGINNIHMILYNTTGDLAYPFSTPISFRSDAGVTTVLENWSWNNYDITSVQGESGWLSLPITGLDWGGNPIVATNFTGLAINLQGTVSAGDYLEIDNIQLRETEAPFLIAGEASWNSRVSVTIDNGSFLLNYDNTVTQAQLSVEVDAVMGDLDGDGTVSILDLLMLKSHLESPASYEINKNVLELNNGAVTVGNLTAMSQYLLNEESSIAFGENITYWRVLKEFSAADAASYAIPEDMAADSAGRVKVELKRISTGEMLTPQFFF